MSVDEEWSKFLNNIDSNDTQNTTKIHKFNEEDKKFLNDIPKCGDIYISTKTKIIYLNREFDIYNIFWEIPLIDYNNQEEGIIKKQVKISSCDKDEVSNIENMLSKEKYVISKIINHIDNPNGRIKFKHVRKISIGLCKKDLIYARTKDKSAFYNCFVITLRVLYNKVFKEIHVKVFNTGKLEIPGIQNDAILEIVLKNVINILKNITKDNIYHIENKTENVLINSNFNCGFYINRETLFNILRYKYHINASYDPCSYPGIQCVYYYDNITNEGISKTLEVNNNNKKDMLKISYMIFRTGSILIVGKCCENVLYTVYEYIKNILYNEYREIMTSNIDRTIIKPPKINTKVRKKYIYVE